ncbi:hypothetical protein [Methylotuvimicrobium alcaliphilum]|uniref:Lipocalin-like domain-containing protein n=1 Tax=Methylotuvimicrobium alcaliphilum (strain DSM 19304 / NCIMB 14124 / VKM B-2133 / 20Z) TaxID=1091494 RepID=G4SZ68_META2|nr:hypothetical protein [Methylotuvimicrobium alcaliphilum]CCE22218.1 conserved exported protein of unknown function [Methylotuvimicrobium alcaliphilum 20Z]
MNIKKRIHVIWPAVLLAFAVNAEVLLKDQSEILGKWNLYAEAAKLEGEKKDLSIEWDFKSDGVLNTKSIDTFGRTKTFEVALKYSVEDGMIRKQSTPGREKYESCKVIEKSGSDMILKCTYLFFFLTKK